MWKKRRCQLHRLDMPRNLAAGPSDRVAIDARASFEQVFCNPERFGTCFRGDPITIFARQRLSRASETLAGCVRFRAEKSRTVVFDQRLHDGLGIAMWDRTARVIWIECQRVATAAVFVH